MSNYQARAIVGDRHFVLVNEGNPDVFAIPGQDEVGEEFIKGARLRVFKPRTATLAQLRDWARSVGQPLVVVDRFPVMRPE